LAVKGLMKLFIPTRKVELKFKSLAHIGLFWLIIYFSTSNIATNEIVKITRKGIYF